MRMTKSLTAVIACFTLKSKPNEIKFESEKLDIRKDAQPTYFVQNLQCNLGLESATL